MSVHVIYYQQGHKMMKAVETEEAYRRYRDSQTQVRNLTLIRHPQEDTDVAAAKRKLVQFNYSCLPTEDGCLKGATRLSKSVGMDIDHLSADEVNAIAATAIDKKEEQGLLMLERSARGGGLHVVFRRHPEMDQEANLRWASDLLGVEYDAGAKDITRVFFATTSEDLLYLHEDLFDNGECGAFTGQETAFTDSETTFASQEATSTDLETSLTGQEESFAGPKTTTQPTNSSPEEGKQAGKTSEGASPLNYDGVPYDRIIKKWWAFYNQGKTPSKSNRNTLTFELAVNLRHICGFDRSVLDRVIPCYDGFAETEKLSCIDSALGERKTQMPRRLKEVVEAVRQDMIVEGREVDSIDEAMEQDDLFYYNELPQMPLGVRESINAVGPHLAMPAIFAITPAIGMLATGVRVDIHGKPSQLNLISYIAGDFASGKGSIDPIVAAWLAEVKMVDKGYLQAEEEWRARKRAAKNKKEQPEDPKYPVRWLTLNTTVANLADRLANTCGKHAFSFTPEADTVSQKWRTAMSDFSVMLRQAYDGTPDNTFSPLSESLYRLTEDQETKIQQVAHLLPFMSGDVRLPLLEKRGRQWLEQIRLESIKNDDKTLARQRFRTCPTAMRMMTCLMLCRVAERLINSYGMQGAETRLKGDPTLWQKLILRQQTPQMLAAFDVLADYMIDNAMYFFKERIEMAFRSAAYAPKAKLRSRKTKNDTIFEQLGEHFNTEDAYCTTVSTRGFDVARARVISMLCRWERQGLVERIDKGVYRKLTTNVVVA